MKKKQILIFKTDRIGDFVNFSPCLKILKSNIPNSEITIVCSVYNYQIIKNYKEIDKILIIEKNLIKDLIKIKSNINNKFYDYFFQMDGNNNSYYLSLFVKSKIKSTIFFYKNKNFLFLKFKIIRPNFFLRKIFNNYEFCDEDYNNKVNTHYQSLYFKLMKNLSFDISHKQNVFYLDASFKKKYEQISNTIPKNFTLLHIDDKSNVLNPQNKIKLINFILNLSKNRNLIITLGIGKIDIINDIKKRIKIINYDEDLSEFNSITFDNILAIKDLPLNLLAYFLNFSEVNISMHSGSIVHISTAFNKKLIDILDISKNNEIDRWIPVVSNYQRINFNELENFKI